MFTKHTPSIWRAAVAQSHPFWGCPTQMSKVDCRPTRRATRFSISNRRALNQRPSRLSHWALETAVPNFAAAETRSFLVRYERLATLGAHVALFTTISTPGLALAFAFTFALPSRFAFSLAFAFAFPNPASLPWQRVLHHQLPRYRCLQGRRHRTHHLFVAQHAQY